MQFKIKIKMKLDESGFNFIIVGQHSHSEFRNGLD